MRFSTDLAPDEVLPDHCRGKQCRVEIDEQRRRLIGYAAGKRLRLPFRHGQPPDCSHAKKLIPASWLEGAQIDAPPRFAARLDKPCRRRNASCRPEYGVAYDRARYCGPGDVIGSAPAADFAQARGLPHVGAGQPCHERAQIRVRDADYQDRLLMGDEPRPADAAVKKQANLNVEGLARITDRIDHRARRERIPNQDAVRPDFGERGQRVQRVELEGAGYIGEQDFSVIVELHGVRASRGCRGHERKSDERGLKQRGDPRLNGGPGPDAHGCAPKRYPS